jgi:hypothetical protein
VVIAHPLQSGNRCPADDAQEFPGRSAMAHPAHPRRAVQVMGETVLATRAGSVRRAAQAAGDAVETR